MPAAEDEARFPNETKGVHAFTAIEMPRFTCRGNTNFAKRGDPNGKGVPTWQAFSDAKPVLMYFAQTPHKGPVPSADALKVLDENFAWRRTPAGQAAVK